MVKVSVIIPVYNVFPYLGACLDSVTGQTLRDIEILCIDDCSTDNSLALLRERAKSDPRIRVFANERNRDVSYSRNRGIREACGEYVYFLDSDDTLYAEDVLERLYRTAGEDDADLVAGQTVDWFFDDPDLPETVNADLNPGESLHRQTVKDCPLFSRNVIACNKLLRRAFLLEHGLFFDEALLKFEDNDFACRVAIRARSMSFLAVRSYRYRKRIRSSLSKMHSKDPADAFWKCHAARNMAVALRQADADLQRVYAENLGDMLRGAYRDFIRYGDGRVEPFMAALREAFEVLPEGLARQLPPELRLSFDMLRAGKIRAAWTPLFLYKKLRLLYYLRYLVPLLRDKLRHNPN